MAATERNGGAGQGTLLEPRRAGSLEKVTAGGRHLLLQPEGSENQHVCVMNVTCFLTGWCNANTVVPTQRCSVRSGLAQANESFMHLVSDPCSIVMFVIREPSKDSNVMPDGRSFKTGVNNCLRGL